MFVIHAEMTFFNDIEFLIDSGLFVQTCFRVFIGTEVALFQLIKSSRKKRMGAISNY